MKIDDGATTVRSFSAASSRDESQPADWDEQFDELYRENRPKLLAYARRRNALDAELVVDQALFDFYRAKERLRSNNSKVYWAYMYRAVDSHLARERGRPVPDLTDDLDDIEEVDSFEQQLIDHMSFEDTMALLTPSQAAALRLQMVDGMTSAQAGDALGKSSTATRQLQHQALVRLRRLLYGLAIAIVVAGGAVVLLQANGSVPTEEAPTDVPVESSPTTTSTGDGDALTVETDSGGEALRVESTTEDQSAQVSVGGAAQLEPVAGEVGVTFANVGSRKCLDAGNPQSLIQWACHGDEQQRFVQADAGNGTGFFLRLQSRGLCLSVADAVVQTAECDGDEYQIFRWAGAELQAINGTCLAIAGGALDNAAKIVTASCDGSPAQQFVTGENPVESLDAVKALIAASTTWAPPAPESDLMIKNVRSNLCLDLSSPAALGPNQFECHGGDNQRFHQVELANGFALQLTSTGYCLDALNPRVAFMPCSGAAHQTFTWVGDQLQEQSNGSCLMVDGEPTSPLAWFVAVTCENLPEQQFVSASRQLGGSAPEPISLLVERIANA